MRLSRIKIAVLLVILAILIAWPAMVIGQVGRDGLKNCSDLAFSTEEDFLTRGSEPVDGNPIISDGDLLGLIYSPTGTQCAVCARNYDLLNLNYPFDISADLGLDAVDVIDVEDYLVAFSTELDSPNQGQFTAGDLLVTNGAVILNTALTDPYQIGYDIGLDAVHFVGDPADILLFLVDAAAFGEPIDATALTSLLADYNMDIWYSTEGTMGPVTQPGFLDGDLLSVRSNIPVSTQDVILPGDVPAGIPARGVDFGLDAVTARRLGELDRLLEEVHFSTEILYRGERAFTDGDVLQFGNGVIMENRDLIGCFQPAVDFLGLDALSVYVPPSEDCVSHLQKIAGFSVADISLTDGMLMTGTLGINASLPFGGRINFEGGLCPNVDRYRMVYRKAGTSGSWLPIPVLPIQNWTIEDDAFFPPGQDCIGSRNWASDSDGWYSGPDYRQVTEPALWGCNWGLSLSVWESTSALPSKEDLYEVALETEVASVVSTDTIRLVQLDNTPPKVELEKVAGVCDAFTEDDMPIMVTARMTDTHFFNYRLEIAGDGYTPHPYSLIAFYDDPTDNVIDTGTVNYDNYVDLHLVDVGDLVPSGDPVKCGYSVELTGWDRTISCKFNYLANWPSRCAACRYDDDTWGFEYAPSLP